MKVKERVKLFSTHVTLKFTFFVYLPHKVLRPFILRRLKIDVERQMPKKYEHVVTCQLSKRQRLLYNEFMALASTKVPYQTRAM
jgi:SNF2 family DNA or RNA helicase